MRIPRFPRPRLITFDAFGTLYTPRGSVAQQYSEIAKRYNVHVTEDEVSDRFKSAYNQVVEQYPNYGVKQGLSVQDWWRKIVQLTFQGKNLSEEGIDGLYNHFNTKDAYHFYPDAYSTLHEFSHRKFNMGILSNSDARMRMTMEDMGIEQLFGANNVCLSYETGYEKPHEDAFLNAQKLMLKGDFDPHNCWHVGDDIKKDFEGALKVGWNSILVDREGDHIKEALEIAKHNANSIYNDNIVIVSPGSINNIQDGGSGIKVYIRDLSYLLDLF